MPNNAFLSKTSKIKCKPLIKQLDRVRSDKNKQLFDCFEHITYLPSFFELYQILTPFLQIYSNNPNTLDKPVIEKFDSFTTKHSNKYDVRLLISSYCYNPNEAYFLNEINVIDYYCKIYYPSLNIIQEIIEIIVCEYIGAICWNNEFMDKMEQYNEFKQKQKRIKSVKKSLDIAKQTLQTWNPNEIEASDDSSDENEFETDTNETKSNEKEINLSRNYNLYDKHSKIALNEASIKFGFVSVYYFFASFFCCIFCNLFL